MFNMYAVYRQETSVCCKGVPEGWILGPFARNETHLPAVHALGYRISGTPRKQVLDLVSRRRQVFVFYWILILLIGWLIAVPLDLYILRVC